MLSFKVDKRRRIDEFLRDNGFQQYKILLLVAAGAVLRTRGGGSSVRVKSESEQVDTDEVVAVDDRNALYRKKIETLAADEYRDYVFTIDHDDYFRNMAELVRWRGNTIELSNAKDFVAFVRALVRDPMVTNPIRHLFVISHADFEGYLFTYLDDRIRAESILTGKLPSIDYDDLENKVGSRLKIDPNALTPRPRVPPWVVDLRRQFMPKLLGEFVNAEIPPFLHIRGCGIGKVRPYMMKLKELLGGKVIVTAPFYFQVVDGVSSPRAGRIEYFLYQFRVTAPKPFGDRDELLNAFRTEADLKDMYGKQIPAQSWRKWLPRTGLTAEGEQTWNERVISPIDARRRTFVLGRYRYKLRHFLRKSEWPIPSDRNTDAKRRAFVIDSVGRWPQMAPGNAYPGYQRYGYKSFDEFAKGWTWNIERGANGGFLVTVQRHEHVLAPPVVEAGSGRLFLNFFPTPPRDNSAPPSPTILIPDADPRFFGVF